MRNREWLESLINALFIYDNVPDTIDIDFVNFALNNFGFITWLEADDGTIRTLQGAISGIDVYSRPVKFTSTNPVKSYSGLERTIGEDCVVMYNTPNRRKAQSNIPLLNKYAALLNNIDVSINTAITNTRASTIYRAKNDVEAQHVRNMLDQVNAGKPFVLVNDDIVGTLLGNSDTSIAENLPVKANYVLDLLLRDRYTVICNFLTELGINNTPFEKKERQIETEVDSNNELLNISNWGYLKARQDALDAVNSMFNQNITVKFNRELIERVIDIAAPSDV